MSSILSGVQKPVLRRAAHAYPVTAVYLAVCGALAVGAVWGIYLGGMIA